MKQRLVTRYVLGVLALCFLTGIVQAQTGEYLNFDGVDDAITATQQTTVKDNFTIEFWARPTATIALPAQATGGADAIGGGRFVICPVWGPSIAGSSAGAGVSVGTNGVCVVEHGDGYVPSLLTWAGTVSGWTHIAVVYTNKQPTLFINGVLVATGLTSLQANVFVTTNSYGGGPFGYFSGDMDELRIWDRSLTATEISSQKNIELVGNEAGLIDYYNFNQGTAAGTNTGVTTLVDATTPANNGMLNNFALTGFASNWLSSLLNSCSDITNRIYVTTTGTGNGSSWANAMSNLQAALDNTCGVTEIWVAKGTYKPTATTNQSIAFVLPSGIKLYGGFNGNESLLSERNVAANPTILSGNIGDLGTNADNSLNVMTITDAAAGTLVDGITFSDANLSSAVSISNSTPTLTNCTFKNNTSYNGGGLNFDNSTVTLSKCLFQNNTAGNVGGAISSGSGTLLASDCVFTSNTAGASGGVFATGLTTATFSNCLFYGNSNISYLGSVIYSNATANLENCTVVGNNGSASFAFQGLGSGTLKNCIVWGNSSFNPFNSNQPAVSYSIIQNVLPSGAGNVSADPLFVNAADPDGADNIFGTADDGLVPSQCSPAIDAAQAPSPTLDLAGNPRVDAPVIGISPADMGAYEQQDVNFPVVITDIAIDNISALLSNSTTCTDDDYFTGDVTVTFTNISSSGTLSLSGDILVSVTSVPIANTNTPTTHTFMGVRMKALGTTTLIASFSDMPCTYKKTFPGTPALQQTLYGVDPFDPNLYAYSVSTWTNQSTQTLTMSGFTVQGVLGFSHNPQNGLYYAILKTNNGRRLATVDLATGVCTHIGNLGDNFSGITFASDGTLYGCTGTGATVANSLYTINPATAGKTFRQTLTRNYGQVIAYNPQDGFIYHWTKNYMEKIDPVSYALTEIPLSGGNFGEPLGAVYKGNGTFYMGDYNSSIYSISASGEMTLLNNNLADDLRGYALVSSTPLPCAVSNISLANTSGCTNPGNTTTPTDDYFTTDVTVTFAYAPAGGMLTLKRGTTVVATTNADLTCSTTYTFTGVQMAADGSSILLTAEFANDCTFTSGSLGTAPEACSCVPTTPSVSIAASPSGTITAGTSVTFTATPTNQGTTPTYTWKKGSTTVGTNSTTYTDAALANGDVITCEMTPSAEVCPTVATVISTGITMSVTYVYTWTGATSTDWATATNWNPNGIPTSTDNVIIPTTANKPMLPANQTIANMNLTGTNKVMLGNSTLCVNAITGGSAASYVVTDGTGSLIIKALPTNAATTFPIGASETSYDPLSIRPTHSVDFTAKVKATTGAGDFSGSIISFLKVAPRQWDITPTGNAGSTVLTLTNGGAAYTVVGTPKVGHYSSTVWTELAATHNNGTWTATTSSFSPFGVGEAGGFMSVLPVELLTFTGYNKGTVNILNWATANEINNKGFQVERAPQPPKGAFEKWDILGFINAKGKAATYDFTDFAPPLGAGGAYYRLRQIDNDGTETYSKVISVSLKGNNKLKVYPNPVSNVLTVENTEGGDFQILNLLGQEVLNGKTPALEAGGINVSALPQGAYFLKVGTEQVKFIKQ